MATVVRAPALILISLALLTGVLGGHRLSTTPYRLADHDVRVSHIAVVGDSYTTGGIEGGLGPNGWSTRAGQLLERDGKPIAATVAAEGGAGYGVPGNHGSTFTDLTSRAVDPGDVLVVFFGSRNDDVANPDLLGGRMRDALTRARDIAPAAKLLVIGPPWPTADVPGAVLRVRDILVGETWAAHGEFIDPLAQGWFVGRPDLIGGDGVHPNDAGHAYLAEMIAPLISARLPA